MYLSVTYLSRGDRRGARLADPQVAHNCSPTDSFGGKSQTNLRLNCDPTDGSPWVIDQGVFLNLNPGGDGGDLVRPPSMMIRKSTNAGRRYSGRATPPTTS
jgi:hypothetical protein